MSAVVCENTWPSPATPSPFTEVDADPKAAVQAAIGADDYVTLAHLEFLLYRDRATRRGPLHRDVLDALGLFESTGRAS